MERMGFSQADWQEHQINLDRIRFGNRIQPRPPIHVPGLPNLDKPKPPLKDRKKADDDPGYARFQGRLW